MANDITRSMFTNRVYTNHTGRNTIRYGLRLPSSLKTSSSSLVVSVLSKLCYFEFEVDKEVVTSQLRIQEWGRVGYGLIIKSKDSTSSSMLIGREYVTETQDDEKIYPGLPLFQNRPFELPQDGKKIWCQSLVLKFATAEDRGMWTFLNAQRTILTHCKAGIRDMLVGVYNASLVDG